MIVVIFFLVAQSPTGFHFLEAKGKLYFASPEGLYRFDPQGPNLNRFTDIHGLSEGRIRFLAYDDGLIWVASDSGFANGDIRLNDWRIILRGEPEGIAFDDDYVYLSLGNGLFRYEKLTEDIEPISDSGGLLIRDGDQIILIGQGYSYYYDIKSEEMSDFGIPAWLRGEFLIESEDLIGAFDDDLILRQRGKQEWQKYEITKINDYAVTGDSIIFATDSGLIVFDPQVKMITPYPWIYRGRVNAIARRSEFVAAATDSGIYEFGIGIKRETESSGLPEDRILATYYLGDYLIGITDNFIVYRDEKGWQWFRREKVPVRRRFFYWDETGTYLVPFNHQISFRGRASYAYQEQGTLEKHKREVIYESSDTTVDISASTELFTGKLSGFYNNTEPERIDYGIGYNSARLVKRVFYGKDRFGLAQSQLTPTQQGIGIGGEVGGRLSVFGFHGEKIGVNRVDVFPGNTIEKRLTIRDSSYQQFRFFMIDTIIRRLKLEKLEIYYDDLNPETNTTKTLISFTIGGKVGDYDLLEPVNDYSYNDGFGVVDLKTVRTGVIAVKYDNNEAILDSTHMLKNYYWIGYGILPYSLDLTITDNLGVEYPLYQFGIDNNRDGLIDDEYIDFENGILRFPSPIMSSSISYNLEFEFETRALLYQLSYYPVVRNSDKVMLDGEELRRGSDYIIDYSTGILLILKSEMTSPGSEIEIHYEEELLNQATKINQTGIQLRVRPIDQLKFSPGGYSSAGKTIYTVPLEIRTRDILLRTEVVSDQKDYGGRTELKLKHAGNYVKASGDYLPDSIEDFGVMTAKNGRWVKRGDIGVGFEVYDLKIRGDYRRGLARDSLQDYHEDERVITMDLYPKKLPYLTLKRGRREGFGDKKDFYKIETGHSFQKLRGRFGIGREYGDVSVNDVYSEIEIFNSRFYQRRTDTRNYTVDLVEVGSLVDFIDGFIIKTNIYKIMSSL